MSSEIYSSDMFDIAEDIRLLEEIASFKASAAYKEPILRVVRFLKSVILPVSKDDYWMEFLPFTHVGGSIQGSAGQNLCHSVDSLDAKILCSLLNERYAIRKKLSGKKTGSKPIIRAGLAGDDDVAAIEEYDEDEEMWAHKMVVDAVEATKKKPVRYSEKVHPARKPRPMKVPSAIRKELARVSDAMKSGKPVGTLAKKRTKKKS